MKVIVRDSLNVLWNHHLFDSEGFERHRAAMVELADAHLPNGSSIRAGSQGAVRGRPGLFFAAFALTAEAVPLYAELMRDVPKEDYAFQDVDPDEEEDDDDE